VGLAACEETDECKKLKKVKQAAEKALVAAKGRAKLADRTGQTLERIKTATEKKLDEHGLDLPEEELQEELEARVADIEGAELERTVRPVAPDPHAQSPVPETETMFRVTFPARGLEAAWAKARTLFATPPLTRVLGFFPPKEPGEGWRLELGRVDIQRLPMDIEPRPLPRRPSAEDVESELGFCGASELREEIAELEAKIAKYQDKAGQTTMNLPLSASWTGLARRADLAIETEKEGRRIADALVEAVLEARQRLVGLGLEKEAVLLEIRGGQKNLSKVQAQLSEGLLESMQDIEGERDGVARMAVGNRVAAAGRRPDRSPAGHGRSPGRKAGE
jgi:hypothetical protein